MAKNKKILEKLRRRGLNKTPESTGHSMKILLNMGYSIEEIAEAYYLDERECQKYIDDYEEIEAYKEMAKGKPYENIDMGKVGALRRAGWNMEKIGSEFGKTEEEMCYIIEQWKKDMGKENCV